jgi:two-component system aerobic respiration control sensor histidine kinase ArcB
MLPLVTALNAIQKIANDFSGDFSIKNSNGKYIYVNEGWLKATARTSDESLGKSVEEIFSSDLVKLVTDSDKKAWESNDPVVYDNELVINGKLVESVVIKWAIRYKNGEPFFLCTFSARPENREEVLALKTKIETVLSSVIA